MGMRASLFALVVIGCSDGGAKPDGGPDDAIVPVDVDNGTCGAQLRFTGEYADWDTHTTFCGINKAVFSVPGGTMDETAPNGRFDLCIPDQAVVRVAVTQPIGNSQCTMPQAAYTIPVIAIARKDVIQAGGTWSGRAFTQPRQASFFQLMGKTFDPTKAHVFLHVDRWTQGAAPPVLSAAHDPAWSVMPGVIDPANWTAGDTGPEVFFPNVEVGAGTATLTMGAVGDGEIPLVAGTLTLISIRR